MEDVSRTVHQYPDYLRPLHTQFSLAGTEDTLEKYQRSENNEAGGRTSDVIPNMGKEITEGVAVDTPYQCVVGREPL